MSMTPKPTWSCSLWESGKALTKVFKNQIYLHLLQLSCWTPAGLWFKGNDQTDPFYYISKTITGLFPVMCINQNKYINKNLHSYPYFSLMNLFCRKVSYPYQKSSMGSQGNQNQMTSTTASKLKLKPALWNTCLIFLLNSLEDLY